eukprot:6119153-Pyramimonas_sp.AAC.1
MQGSSSARSLPVRPHDKPWGADRLSKHWAATLRRENAGVRAGILFLASAAAVGVAALLLHTAP